MWLSFALCRLTLAASRFHVPPTPLPLPVRCCKEVPHRSHSKILLMVTDVEEVLFCILPRTAIREVDESVHSCELCCEEVDEVFLEEVNSNIWCFEYCSQISQSSWCGTHCCLCDCSNERTVPHPAWRKSNFLQSLRQQEIRLAKVLHDCLLIKQPASCLLMKSWCCKIPDQWSFIFLMQSVRLPGCQMWSATFHLDMLVSPDSTHCSRKHSHRGGLHCRCARQWL